MSRHRQRKTLLYPFNKPQQIRDFLEGIPGWAQISIRPATEDDVMIACEAADCYVMFARWEEDEVNQ